MNVLCDRHHAGLLYFMQLLFEDRLGCQLYIPVGREWYEEGYWMFGQGYGDDRLVRQYLHLHDEDLVLGPDEAVPTRNFKYGRDYYTMRDHNEFPDREIRGVTLEQFHRLGDWSFVVATVQDNQPGFARLASEVGAKYVLQVGNRGQQVNWDLDPLAIVTAEAPVLGRGVVVHQEFDKDTVFAFREPPEVLDQVHSYVNCFDRIDPQWARFLAYEQLLPEFSFKAHGSDGREGKVVPTTLLADTMAKAAFGWHDKPQGDGFGHVLHYWAAIGRPLVGYASNYRGLMGEILWDDGVTSINLDDKPAPQVLAEIRAVAANPTRHREMCLAIRAKLDTLVDYNAEEAAIRGLLELPKK